METVSSLFKMDSALHLSKLEAVDDLKVLMKNIRDPIG
jgi:hypothetical protein